MVELLVLGPESSGKSLVIRRLSELCVTNQGHVEVVSPSTTGDEFSESTIPTVGVNISSIQIGDLSLEIREIGAAMASRWDTYIPDCSALLFVIDTSDMGSLASSLVLLYEVLSNETALKEKPLAILFNKLDLVGDPQTTLNVFYNTLRIDDLISRSSTWKHLVLLSGTALDINGSAKAVRDWILDSQLDRAP
jgi:GTPase SAR1 family protein